MEARKTPKKTKELSTNPLLSSSAFLLKSTWFKLQVRFNKNPNAQDAAGNTALHLLAVSKAPSEKSVESLLAARADPYSQNRAKESPLSLAEQHHQYRMVELLKNAHEERTLQDLATSKLPAELTALIAAYALDDSDLQELVYLALQGKDAPLLESLTSSLFANPDRCLEVQRSPYGLTRVVHIPILKAIEKDQDTLLRILLTAGANPDLQAEDGRLALHYSLGKGQIKTSQSLLEAGADPSNALASIPKKNHELTKLITNAIKQRDLAVSVSSVDVVKQGYFSLMKQRQNIKAIINAQDEEGCSLLHHAVRKNHIQSVIFLCAQGADVNLCDKEGRTSLHLAAKDVKSIFILKKLLTNADLSITDNQGRTPLDIASLAGNKRAIALIQAHQEAQATVYARSV